MKTRKLTRFLTIFILTFFLYTTTAAAAEFLAHMIISKGKGKAEKLKVYVKNDKIRQEKILRKGKQEITIFRPDKNIMWVIFTKNKMYMDYTYNPAERPFKEWTSKEEKKAKLVGKEKINGFICKKYEYSSDDDKGKNVTVWIAKELSFPIKTEGGKRNYELTNIQIGKVSDSMFEIPKGFQNWN